MIDLHAHVVLESSLGAAGELGPELVDHPDCPTFRVGEYVLEGVRYRGSAFMDVEVRLERMVEAGITHQVLSPNPLTYFQRADAGPAIAFARSHNEELGVLVGRFRELSGLAQLPVQDPPAAVEELRRSVGDLGLLGAEVGTHYDVALDDPSLDQLWAAAVDLDVPIFIHPTPAAVDSPVADPRLGRFDADLWLTFAFEETLALATLVFGGVLDRHPGVRICLSHGGGALVAVIGKLRSLTGRPWISDELAAAGAIDERIGRLWFDAHVSDDAVRSALAALVGTDRLVGATNFAGWDQPRTLPAPALVAELDANAHALLGPRFNTNA